MKICQSAREAGEILQRFNGATGFVDGKNYICQSMYFFIPERSNKANLHFSLIPQPINIRVAWYDGESLHLESLRLHKGEDFTDLLAGATELKEV